MAWSPLNHDAHISSLKSFEARFMKSELVYLNLRKNNSRGRLTQSPVAFSTVVMYLLWCPLLWIGMLNYCKLIWVLVERAYLRAGCSKETICVCSRIYNAYWLDYKKDIKSYLFIFFYQCFFFLLLISPWEASTKLTFGITGNRHLFKNIF